MNVGDTPILPFCAPGTSNFGKCRNRFLGICMFYNNFEDDILFRGRENLKNMNVRDTPFLPLKIKILQNPFLAHLFTSMRTYSQNFMSLTLIVWTFSFIRVMNTVVLISQDATIVTRKFSFLHTHQAITFIDRFLEVSNRNRKLVKF